MEKMKEVILKLASDFNNFPIFLQALSVSLAWVFLFFTADAWFSPFFFRDYQLIFYIFIIIGLSAWLAYQSFEKLISSRATWEWEAEQHPPLGIGKGPQKITLKGITEKELDKLAKSTAESIIEYLSDDSNDSEEFVREIHIQVEDIFHCLTQKLSRIQVDDFVRNIIQILHSHLRSYLKTIGCNPCCDHAEVAFPFAHPVSRGEMPMESYLDSLSHSIMKEFIPGSIQDCSAVFDLGCAAFCSHLLLKFVHCLSQPAFVLQSILQALEPSGASLHRSSTDTPDFSAKLQLSKEDSPSSSSLEQVDDPLSGSSPRGSNDESKDPVLKDAPGEADLFSRAQTSSPVLAGSLMPSCPKSCVETGLCSGLSTATAPLLSSQAGDQQQVTEDAKSKPSSLPLEEKKAHPLGIDSEAQSGGGSTEADISPVYEDVENFASAIAKLRSLLEQRNTPEANNTSARNNKDSSSPMSYSPGGETESSFEELAEASELPKDNRIFLNIKIPRTEVCTLPGEGQHSVYCIVYDGIYTAVSNATGPEECPKEPRLVLKSRTVRRRFRHFLQLHEQLEASEDQSIAQDIRTIRGPSKWLNLPFSRQDPNTTLHRQTFLERYMSQLTSSVPIGTSAELRQFLDYELQLSEGTPSFSLSGAALQRVPFFAKTMSGVLQSIKTALPLQIPGFESDQSRSLQLLPLPPPSPLAPVPQEPSQSERDIYKSSSTEEVDGRLSPVPCRVVYASEESKLEQLLFNWNQHLDCRVESAYEALESQLWRSELNSLPGGCLDSGSPGFPKATNHSFHGHQKERSWDRFDGELPLSSSVINLVVECLSCRDTWLTKAPVALAVKILVGQQLEQKFQESLYKLANPERLSDRLRRFRKKLDASANHSNSFLDQDDLNVLVTDIVCSLENKLPGLVTRILGETLTADVLKTVVSCFADAKLNRDLALTLLDFMFAQISSLTDSTSTCRSSPF